MIARIKRPVDLSEIREIVLFDDVPTAVDDLFNKYRVKRGNTGGSIGLVIANKIAVLIPLPQNEEIYILGELDQDAEEYPRGTLVFEFEDVIDKRAESQQEFKIMFDDLCLRTRTELLAWRGVPDASAMNWDTMPLFILEQEE